VGKVVFYFGSEEALHARDQDAQLGHMLLLKPSKDVFRTLTISTQYRRLLLVDVTFRTNEIYP
jgi:hypothetical protein